MTRDIDSFKPKSVTGKSSCIFTRAECISDKLKITGGRIIITNNLGIQILDSIS